MLLFGLQSLWKHKWRKEVAGGAQGSVPQQDLSNPSFTFLFLPRFYLHQKNSWAFSRVQEKGLIPWKAWVDGQVFSYLNIQSAL